MFEVKLTVFCFFILSSAILAAKMADYKNIYIKSFRCNSSAKFTHQNYTCFAKSYNRTLSTVNGYGLAKFPLYNIHVSIFLDFLVVIFKLQVFGILYFKYGMIYRPVITTPKVNICDFNRWLGDIEQSPNKLMASAIKLIKASVPDLIHECPYIVRKYQIKSKSGIFRSRLLKSKT